MALTINECEQMIIAAEKNEVILQIGYMMQFHPVHQYIKREITAGTLGSIQFVP